MSEENSGTLSNEANLVVNQDVEVPSPFAVQIASVSISSLNNYFDEGYELDLSATFGQDYIRLQGDDGVEIEAYFGINQAEVLLSFANSYPTHGPHYHDYHRLDEKSVHVEKTTERKEKSSGNLGADLKASFGVENSASKASGDVLLSKNFEKDRISFQTSRSVRNRGKFIVPTVDRVLIGAQDSEFPLDGVAVAGYRGWKVVPKENVAKSGAVAKLRVQETWISVADVKVSYAGGKVGPDIKGLFESTSSEANQRRIFFELLLRKLVFLGLQDSQDRDYATLAADAFVVEPERELSYNIPATQQRLKIPLNPALISRFLNASEEEMREIAADPTKYLVNKVKIYEFPCCHPISLFRYLGLPTSNFPLTPAVSNLVDSSVIGRELDFLDIPYRNEFTRVVIALSRSTGAEKLIDRVEKVPVIKEALSRYSIARFGTEEPRRKEFRLSNILWPRKKTQSGMVRSFLREYFQKKCGNSIALSEIEEKVEYSIAWVELILLVKHRIKMKSEFV
ncbi:hypothetical protein AAFO92_17200 [Roseovarius sp. CAU 1744]|uniref:hypothetical protein n=1 Tax=Roseovarius sp. CAU 1744 TaxID=3140368 RepID=UPI00325AD2E1